MKILSPCLFLTKNDPDSINILTISRALETYAHLIRGPN